MKGKTCCLLVLVNLVALSAFAGSVPVGGINDPAWGTLLHDSGSYAWTGAGVSLSITSQVRFSESEGLYTYFYQLESTGSGSTIVAFNFEGDWGEIFEWGVLSEGTSAGVGLDSAGVTFADGMTVNFSDGAGDLGGLDSGESITLYVRSRQASGFFVEARDSLFSGQELAHAPEPASILLMTTGIVSTLGFARKKILQNRKKRTALPLP